MALRLLARKVGIPAFRLPAGARPLNSSSSQGGGAAAKPAGKDLEAEVARLKAECATRREATKKALKDEQTGRRYVMGSSVAGLCIGLFMIEQIRREQRKLIKECKL